MTEAAKIYGEVLRLEPAHFEALHALGIVCYQRGQLDDAEQLIAQAGKVNPHAADAAYNHACLLQRLNRSKEAVASFDRALSINPDYLEALVNRGNALSAMKRNSAVGTETFAPEAARAMEQRDAGNVVSRLCRRVRQIAR